jgi:hypothetical protein
LLPVVAVANMAAEAEAGFFKGMPVLHRGLHIL